MFAKLFLAFTLIPVIELYLLIKVGSLIGAMETIALIIAMGVFGAALARAQGVQILLDLRKTLQAGKNPSQKIIEGLLVFVGGIALLTPGFLSDLLGLSLLLPFTRKFYLGYLQNYFEKQLQRGRWVVVDNDVIDVN